MPVVTSPNIASSEPGELSPASTRAPAVAPSPPGPGSTSAATAASSGTAAQAPAWTQSTIAAPAPSAATRPVSPLEAEALIRRGDAVLALRNVSAARLLYSRAAAAGSSRAMLALGKTYDPLFLADIGAHGLAGDVPTAVGWYRRVLALGVEEARERLRLHGVRPDD